MRLTLTLFGYSIIDFTLGSGAEQDEQAETEELRDVHDLSTQHERSGPVGFGWQIPSLDPAPWYDE